MPFEAVKPYTEYIVNKYKEFNPIYMVSGDTDFQNEYSSEYYMEALKTIKKLSPEALTTMHIGGGRSDLPKKFVMAKELDFYTYQSSHGLKDQFNAYKLAEDFMAKEVKRPIINSEPCYEGHGFGGEYGRFSAFDVRKAIWQSLLSGAKAGVTYGAHGLWGFHRVGDTFASEDFSSLPFDFKDAYRLEGAWDAGFAKWIFETFNLFNIEPRNLVLNETEEIRLSVSKDNNKFIIYVPYSIKIKLGMDIKDFKVSIIELTNRNYIKPKIEFENGNSIIDMYSSNSDAIIIGIK